jgi:hypothetical protein
MPFAVHARDKESGRLESGAMQGALHPTVCWRHAPGPVTGPVSLKGVVWVDCVGVLEHALRWLHLAEAFDWAGLLAADASLGTDEMGSGAYGPSGVPGAEPLAFLPHLARFAMDWHLAAPSAGAASDPDWLHI